MFDRVVVAILDMSDRAYIVTESVVPVLHGGVKLLQLLDRLGFPQERQGIVLSRYAKVTGGLKPVEVAERLGRTVDHVVPYDRNVLISANTGEPNILRGGGWFSGFVKSVKPLVRDIERLASQPERNGHVGNGQSDAQRIGMLPTADAGTNEDEEQPS
jgi:pilus assembly protein CpaE